MPVTSAVSPPTSAQPAWRQPSPMPRITCSATALSSLPVAKESRKNSGAAAPHAGAVLTRRNLEQRPETADASQHPGTFGRARDRPDGFDQRIAGVDVHAG